MEILKVKKMEKPKRIMNKVELAIAMGPLHDWRWGYEQSQLFYGININDKDFKDNPKTLDARMRRTIRSIADYEQKEQIPEEDRLEDKHVPGPGAGSKESLYDRNQFIRSYFRYKKCKIQNNELFIRRKANCVKICIDNNSLQNIKGNQDKNNLGIIFHNLYSLKEITDFCFPPHFYVNESAKLNNEIPYVYRIDFPLTESIIKIIAKIYEIEFIQFDEAVDAVQSLYMFSDDLFYLHSHAIGLKTRKFINHYLRFRIPRHENKQYRMIADTGETKTKTQKNDEYLKKYYLPFDIDIVSLRTLVLWASSKGEEDQLGEKELGELGKYSAFTTNTSCSKVSEHDYVPKAVEYFFYYWKQNEEILAIYKSNDTIEISSGCATYDEATKNIIIDKHKFNVDDLLLIERKFDN